MGIREFSSLISVSGAARDSPPAGRGPSVSRQPQRRERPEETGAGDLYAAGFLYGLTHGYDLPACGRIGAIAAAEVISHMGARPETRLEELVRSGL